MGSFTPPELLTARHDRSQFDCGSTAQTQWLRQHALFAMGQDTARVYVTCPLGEPHVVGYYSLTVGSVGSVGPAIAPARMTKGAGRYPLPVIILTRLGVDVSVQGRGIGRSLVVDALRRVSQAADAVGVRALLIHAENPRARAFYEGLAEFEPAPSDPLHLFLSLKDIRTALG